MDMIAPELLEILVCPETHQPLTQAPEETVKALAARQSEGKLLNRAGDAIEYAVTGALLREDGEYAYLVADGIPVMLVDEAAPMNQMG